MLRFLWKWFIRLAVAAVVILVAVLAYTSIISRPMPEHTFTDTDQLLAIAHRGGAGLWPENTLFAFQNAVRIGVDALEFDVHATSDGELVVIHDATVDRTTDGAGRVDEISWAALRELDAGYRWTADDGASFPFRGMGLRVPIPRGGTERAPRHPYDHRAEERVRRRKGPFFRGDREVFVP